MNLHGKIDRIKNNLDAQAYIVAEQKLSTIFQGKASATI